jgi:hypothetical protein
MPKNSKAITTPCGARLCLAGNNDRVQPLRPFQKAYADAQVHALAQTVLKSGGDTMTFFHPKFFALAIAAVVATGALASSAKAEIVYHSADIGIGNGTYNLDVNGDGITDFTIVSGGAVSRDFFLAETPAPGNAAIVGPMTRGPY